MKNIEILAPVGGPENLNAAVFSGADAIYLGSNLFSARSSATNFSAEELRKAIDFCHIRDVKVYVAVNTLIKNDEIPSLLDFLKSLCEFGADAVIVQDLGVLNILKKCCPGLPIHCSTQMSILSSSAVNFVEELGAKRVVLGRELSISEINSIKINSKVELEVFIHGALCVCVSGQCYFSAMLGSRSGNRGKCAQPCRLPFKTKKGLTHALSLKDLGYIDDLRNLIDIGVHSAKIEGRMKRPEYVAASVATAKTFLNTGEIPAELKQNLYDVFSRSGFTKGYLEGKIDTRMLGVRTKDDVLKCGSSVFANIHSLYRNELSQVPLKVEVSVFVGQNPVLKITDNKKNHLEIVSDYVAQQSQNKPLSKQEIKERFSKFGSTPYFASEISVETDGNSFLPVSVQNALRREAIDALSEKRKIGNSISFTNLNKITEHREATEMTFRAEFPRLSAVPNDTDAFEYIYLPLDSPLEHFLEISNRKSIIGAVMPTVAFGDDIKIYEKAEVLVENGIITFACPNLYAVNIVKSLNAVIHLTHSMNITNNYGIELMEELGVNNIELSFELTGEEIVNIKSSALRGLMIYGRQSLMTIRTCPHKTSANSCKTCDNPDKLIDRMNIEFPLFCSKHALGVKNLNPLSDYRLVLNSTPLNLFDRLREVKNVDFGVLRFTVESDVEICRILSDFNDKKSGENYTRGLFYRGVQ